MGEQLPEGFPLRRGPLVFLPASVVAKPEAETLNWLSRFDLILTNGYDLAPDTTRLPLQRAGAHLFLYVWSNGFTEKEAQAELPQSGWWREALRCPEWLLNAQPLPGPPGTPPAHFFDLAVPELRDWLAGKLAGWRRQTGYDGFFFDLAGSTALPEEAKAAWEAAHPELPYDRAFAALLEAVRRADPQALLMTNQAFRTLPEALKLADYDLTESYGTSFMWGPEAVVDGQTLAETFVRPWEGPAGLKALYGQVEAALRKAQPRRGFIYLDYMRPGYADGRPGLDAEAVHYSYVAARLWGREGFCSGWYAGCEYRGPLYFADLGRPVGDAPREVGGMVAREYERGLVALLARAEAAEATVKLTLTAGRLHDLYTGRRVVVRDGQVRLRLRPIRSELTDTLRPIGRVYLKTDN